MKAFFGTLLHRLYTSNVEHLIWFGTIVAIMIILAVLHHKWKGDNNKIRLWRMLCILPAIIAMVHAFNGNGDPNIDTRADRISRNPVEERIPFDYDAAMKIFHDKEDYELEWAIQYLEILCSKRTYRFLLLSANGHLDPRSFF